MGFLKQFEIEVVRPLVFADESQELMINLLGHNDKALEFFTIFITEYSHLIKGKDKDSKETTAKGVFSEKKAKFMSSLIYANYGVDWDNLMTYEQFMQENCTLATTESEMESLIKAWKRYVLVHYILALHTADDKMVKERLKLLTYPYGLKEPQEIITKSTEGVVLCNLPVMGYHQYTGHLSLCVNSKGDIVVPCDMPKYLWGTFGKHGWKNGKQVGKMSPFQQWAVNLALLSEGTNGLYDGIKSAKERVNGK